MNKKSTRLAAKNKGGQHHSHDEKLKIANQYLFINFGLLWNDLADINSLHNANTTEDIILLCDERADESNFFL